jgi:hypothetical protein
MALAVSSALIDSGRGGFGLFAGLSIHTFRGFGIVVRRFGGCRACLRVFQ